MSITNLGKLLKCSDNNDVLTIVAKDGNDRVAISVESPGQVTQIGLLEVCEMCDRNLQSDEV